MAADQEGNRTVNHLCCRQRACRPMRGPTPTHGRTPGPQGDEPYRNRVLVQTHRRSGRASRSFAPESAATSHERRTSWCRTHRGRASGTPARPPRSWIRPANQLSARRSPRPVRAHEQLPRPSCPHTRRRCPRSLGAVVLRLPAEAAPDLRRVEQVAAVVAQAIRHDRLQRRQLAGEARAQVRDLLDRGLDAGADVVRLPLASLRSTRSIAAQWSRTCSHSRLWPTEA